MKPFVVATMIVKNEAKILERCFTHVAPLVDAFAIVDTGSTDGTLDVVRAELRNLDKEFAIMQSPRWQGFGHARTMSLGLAEQHFVPHAATLHNKWSLIVDADDVWSGERPLLPSITYGGTLDACTVNFDRPDGFSFRQARYLRLGRGIEYRYVLHEQPLYADGGAKKDVRIPMAHLEEGPRVTSPDDGASYSDPEKYSKHVDVMLDALKASPAEPHYLYYLAQTFRDLGKLDEARAWYTLRSLVKVGELNSEERYLSLLNAGRIALTQGDLDEGVTLLRKAIEAFPATCREAHAELARFHAFTYGLTSSKTRRETFEDVDAFVERFLASRRSAS